MEKKIGGGSTLKEKQRESPFELKVQSLSTKKKNGVKRGICGECKGPRGGFFGA